MAASPTSVLDEYPRRRRGRVHRRASPSPFALLVIADLLGVPERTATTFRRDACAAMQAAARSAARTRTRWRTARWSFCTTGSPPTSRTAGASPRDDVLTGLATAMFPDGSTARGRSMSCGWRRTSSRRGRRRRSGSSAPRSEVLAERPEMQQRTARGARAACPNFVEEALRYREPGEGRLPAVARARPLSAACDLPAGTTVMVLNGAANRDPRRFERPGHLRPRARKNARQHHRVRPWHPQLPRCSARPRRRPGEPSSGCSTARARSESPNAYTDPPTTADTSTCRPTSCAG